MNNNIGASTNPEYDKECFVVFFFVTKHCNQDKFKLIDKNIIAKHAESELKKISYLQCLGI